MFRSNLRAHLEIYKHRRLLYLNLARGERRSGQTLERPLSRRADWGVHQAVATRGATSAHQEPDHRTAARQGERWCQWLKAQPLELLAEAVRMPGGAPEPLRAARHEGTRNASPGAVHCDRAIAGHRAALHPAAAGSAREVGVLNYDGSMPMARRRIQNARTSSKTFTVGRKT